MARGLKVPTIRTSRGRAAAAEREAGAVVVSAPTAAPPEQPALEVVDISGRRQPLQFAKEVSWDDFVSFYFRWEQGEHITLIGPTGQGKTTLALSLLKMRDYVMAIATKQRDPVLYELERMGYQRVREFGELPAEVSPKIVLAANLPRGTESLPEQKRIVHNALTAVYVQGGWTVFLDEARYVTEYLKQEKEVELLWQQGRSSGISVLAAAQRPAWVPLSAFSQATHLFLWRTSDQRDLERIGGLGAHDSRAIAAEVATLPRFTVLYLNTRDGVKIRTKPPLVK